MRIPSGRKYSFSPIPYSKNTPFQLEAATNARSAQRIRTSLKRNRQIRIIVRSIALWKHPASSQLPDHPRVCDGVSLQVRSNFHGNTPTLPLANITFTARAIDIRPSGANSGSTQREQFTSKLDQIGFWLRLVGCDSKIKRTN